MHRRREFPASVKREAYQRSRGVCECHLIPWLRRPDGCGVRLVTGAIFYEHIKTDFHSSDNSLDNCATLTRTCFREKTDRHDLPSIAKTKRVSDVARGIRKEQFRPLPGTIASGWKSKMSGGWVRR
jgi:5-methylcytosine-specific restriction protein A